MIRFCVYKFIQYIINHCPRSVSYRIACGICDVRYFFSIIDRRSVKRNLQSILGSSENLGKHAREMFRNFGKYLVEFFWMEKNFKQFFDEGHIEVVGQKNLDQASQKDKGVILLTAHIGNWEMGAAIVNQLGYPVAAIALPHANKHVNQLFNQQRENQNVEVVAVAEALRKCIKALRAKRAVAIVGDRDFTHNGLEMPFLGRTVTIPKGPALFAAKTLAPIVPVFITRKDNDDIRIQFYEPIYINEEDAANFTEEKVRCVMQEYVTIIEKEIRKNPTQWLMFREY